MNPLHFSPVFDKFTKDIPKRAIETQLSDREIVSRLGQRLISLYTKDSVEEITGVRGFPETPTTESRDNISFGMKIPREIGPNEISFKAESKTEFPWEEHFTGFKGIDMLEKSLMKSEGINMTLRAERNPVKLVEDINRRIFSECELSDAVWENATVEKRLEMLKDAYRIMAEEAMLPKELIDKTIITSEHLDDIAGAETNMFLDMDKDKNLYVNDRVVIKFNESILMDPCCSMKDSLSSLFHETVHVMQQYSLCEGGNSFTYAEMQKEWKDNVTNRIECIRKNENMSVMDAFKAYVTDSMEFWAYAEKEQFERTFDYFQFEYSMR